MKIVDGMIVMSNHGPVAETDKTAKLKTVDPVDAAIADMWKTYRKIIKFDLEFFHAFVVDAINIPGDADAVKAAIEKFKGRLRSSPV